MGRSQTAGHTTEEETLMYVNVKSVVKVLVVLAVVVVFLGFIWPTIWEVRSGGVVNGTQSVPLVIRVHRFSGRTEVLSLTGWAKVTKNEEKVQSPPTVPPPPPATPTGGKK